MVERTDIVIIGSGFSGIGMGIKLKQAGRHDFVILEKNAALGGTWRDNTYPGCTCDVPSHLYSFSFEQNPDWSTFFPSQDEILAYLERCVATYELGPHLRFGTTVTGASFDEQAGRWQVEIGDREPIDTRLVISAVGALHLPHTPDLPGADTFEGTTFHSANWRHDHDLRGRRVAVIGTGASSVQFVPQIAPDVEQLDLYQRSAAWILPKPNPPISEQHRDRFRRHPATQRAVRDTIYWWLEARGLGFTVTPKAMRSLRRQSDRYRARKVTDPDLRRALTPDYQIGCKRVLLSSDFYPAVSRNNVELVTTPIARLTQTGVVDADGVERPADTLIYGTGFDVSGSLAHMPIVGRDGAVLSDLWEERGMGAHLGMSVHGFPNFFVLLGPNTGLGHTSVVFMIEAQIQYLVQAIELLDRYGAATVEVRADTQELWLRRIQRRLKGSVWSAGCTSWYLDEHGRNVALYPSFTWRYWLETRRLDPSDFQLTRAA